MTSTSNNKTVLTKVLTVTPDFFKSSGIAGYNSFNEEGPLDLHFSIQLKDFGMGYEPLLPKQAIVHSAVVNPDFKIRRNIEGTNKKEYVRVQFSTKYSNTRDYSSRIISYLEVLISGDSNVSEDSLETLLPSVYPSKKFEKEDLLNLTITIFYSIEE